MNQTLRLAYLRDSWSRPHGFLGYLREMGCFRHMADAPDADRKANPFWWGATLEFNTLDTVIKDLLSARSIKPARLREFADNYADDLNSPIVRLTGFTLQRMANKMN